MMKNFTLSLLLSLTTILLSFTTAFAILAQPLVTPGWVYNNPDKAQMVILDLQDVKTYKLYHIPGAVNSSYDDWQGESAKKIPHQMPPTSQLEKLIGSLGIDNNTHVVLVTTGINAEEMACATRVYWTFKVLGHDLVSILDGGMTSHTQGTYPVQNGINKAEPKVFQANIRADYTPDAQAVQAALEKGALAVDNRSPSEYMGIYSGNGKERSGCLPKAVNISYDWLTVNGSATFHSVDNLKKIYAANKVPLTGSQIYYCHTGHRASLGWFISHELLGNKQARLYDGSTSEWALDYSLPMEDKIKLKY